MHLAVGRTHPGRRRTSNEDSFVVDSDIALLLVADGMGGHQAGEVASQLAAQTIAEFVRNSSFDSQITWPFGLDRALSLEANQLRTAIQLANRRVFDKSTRQPELSGMGSTVVAALVRGDEVHYASVGDSRLYLLRGPSLRQLSVDDSWAASMLRAGADPKMVEASPFRHALTSALGSADGVDVHIDQESLEDNDVLVMCTDGLHGPVNEARIAAVVAENRLDLARAADRLIEEANEAGGPDNVTVVLFHHQSAGTRKSQPAEKAR